MGKPKSGMVIAIAVVVIELIGGMQTYLSQLILPLAANDLHARGSYGVILGVSTISSMAGLPIGAALMSRVRLPRLLVIATLALIIGAIMSALAPHLVVYIIGSVIRGLAGSILAMSSIGAVALGLSGRARQLTLAFTSASWVISSIVGPAYAAWVTHLLSWRWAMLLYLPLLLIGRIVIATNLQSKDIKKESPFSYKALFLMIAGVGVTIIPVGGVLKIAFLIAGVAILGWVVILLMPRNTFTQHTPRRAALAGMFFLTGGYFTANELITLSAHDIYNSDASSLGFILTGGGLAWAILGVFCGIKPATTQRVYRVRTVIGLGLIISTSIALAAWIFAKWQPSAPAVLFVVVWAIAGIGMGLAYLDTLNIFFEDPDIPDGISIEEMASSSVIVESLSSTMFIPLATSIVAMAFSASNATNHVTSVTPYGIAWVIVAALSCAAFYYLWHARPAAA